jgi:hypothetical protein
MNAADAIVFALLALADLAVIAQLRRFRQSQMRTLRRTRSLALAIRRDAFVEASVPQERLLLRAS